MSAQPKCQHGSYVPIRAPEGHTLQIGVIRCEQADWCSACGAFRIEEEDWRLPRQLREKPAS